MTTTKKQLTRTHFANGMVKEEKETYYLYKLINMQSIAGYQFMLANATCILLI